MVRCVVVLQLRFDFPCTVSSFAWSELFFTACSVVFRLRFDFNAFFFKYNLCIFPVSSPLLVIWPKLSFVALPKYESFRDTTGYVAVNASRQRSTILVFPSSLILPSFYPLLFFAFNSSKAIGTIHHTYIQIPPTYVVPSTDILYPTIIGGNQLPTPLCNPWH